MTCFALEIQIKKKSLFEQIHLNNKFTLASGGAFLVFVLFFCLFAFFGEVIKKRLSTQKYCLSAYWIFSLQCPLHWLIVLYRLPTLGSKKHLKGRGCGSSTNSCSAERGGKVMVATVRSSLCFTFWWCVKYSPFGLWEAEATWRQMISSCCCVYAAVLSSGRIALSTVTLLFSWIFLWVIKRIIKRFGSVTCIWIITDNLPSNKHLSDLLENKVKQNW